MSRLAPALLALVRSTARRAHAAVLVSLLALTLAAAPACQRQAPPARPPGPLRIVVTIPPLAGLARELAPADAQITTLIPPGRSEHGYEFTPDDIHALALADVVVYVGLGIDQRIERLLQEQPRPGRRIVGFARAVGLEDPTPDPDEARAHEAPGDRAEPGEAGGPAPDDDGITDPLLDALDHGPVDPHLWLDPVLVADLLPHLAAAIADAAQQAGDPAADILALRHHDLRDRIQLAHERWATRLQSLAGTSIVTHHDAWQRLATRYGLRIAAVIRPIEGQEPTPRDVEAAVSAIRDQGARAVFVEPQFNPDLARRLAEQAGVPVGTLDPLGDGDWFAMMEANIEALAELLEPPPEP